MARRRTPHLGVQRRLRAASTGHQRSGSASSGHRARGCRRPLLHHSRLPCWCSHACSSWPDACCMAPVASGGRGLHQAWNVFPRPQTTAVRREEPRPAPRSLFLRGSRTAAVAQWVPVRPPVAGVHREPGRNPLRKGFHEFRAGLTACSSPVRLGSPLACPPAAGVCRLLRIGGSRCRGAVACWSPRRPARRPRIRPLGGWSPPSHRW